MTRAYMRLSESQKNIFDYWLTKNEDWLFSDIKSFEDLKNRIDQNLDNYYFAELIISCSDTETLKELLSINDYEDIFKDYDNQRYLTNLREEYYYNLVDFVKVLEADYTIEELKEVINNELEERGEL